MSRPTTAPERIGTDGSNGEATPFTRGHYFSTSTSMAFSPSSRPTSPTSMFAIRFRSQNRDSKGPDSTSTSRPGRFSLQARPADKGKAPLRSDAEFQLETNCNDTASFKTTRTMHSSGFTPYETVHSSSTDKIPSGFSARKNRGSLLGAASDALGLKFGRKRPIIRQPPMPIILPDVIEISAPPPDHEVEERNRLREMAAQAIGISPYMGHSQEGSTEDDEDEEALRTPADSSELRRFAHARSSETPSDFANKNSIPDAKLPPVAPIVVSPMRHRSGSMIHTRTNSTTAFSLVPSFPTNVLALNPFLVHSGYLPKYTQPSSIRIFALSSRNWKNRYIVFSTPSILVSRGHIPTSSYLHVFKSSGPDEKELERLEINEESVIFVAEDEVGGRRSVIKVGGLEVGRQDANSDKVQQTIWHLQITNQSESHEWISTIKNVILGQRTVRAGLGPLTTPTGFEPRGDLDVMLSIRAQGLLSPLQVTPVSSQSHEPVSPPASPKDGNYASSISSRSVRSQSTVPKPNPAGAVSALKGFFSNRPRSSSLATSMTSEWRPPEDSSFSSRGNNLLKLRTTSSQAPSNVSSTVNTPLQQRSALPLSPYVSDQRSDRKVLGERQVDQWMEQPDIQPSLPKETRANRALSLGALSLQPPPRKRWGSPIRPTSASPTDEHGFTYVSRDPTSTTVFGTRSPVNRPRPGDPPSPLELTSFSIPRPDGRPRAPSLRSVSTHGSENAASIDRSSTGTSVNTRRSSTINRRWSRPLPQRLTPPVGPPPAIPSSASANPQPNGFGDRPPSIISTHSSAQSQKSSASTIPSFSKRTSASSAISATSSNHSGNGASPAHSRPLRHSMPPPPRPAPTSALPPAPGPDTPTANKASFRNSVAQRAMRLSMIAPKPPPSATLPPRPDEAEAAPKGYHRRSLSSGKVPALDTILEPVQHTRTSTLGAPFPPPNGPLPPPPSVATSAPTPTAPISRHSSLKQRLRMLSSPSPSPSPLHSSTALPPTRTADTVSPSATPVLAHYFAHSTPSTPADRFTFANANDHSPNFSQMNTPTMLSAVPPGRIFEEAVVDTRELETELPDVLDHVTSLSPPPRRLSKPMIETNWIVRSRSQSQSRSQQLAEDSSESSTAENTPISPADSMTETNNDDSGTSYDNDNDAVDSDSAPRIFSLSPPGSVVSFVGPASL